MQTETCNDFDFSKEGKRNFVQDKQYALQF